MLMTAAIPSLRKDDPTLGLKVSLPNRRATIRGADQEIEQYRAHHPLGTAARLVMEFALETTSRRTEVARLAATRQGWVAQDRALPPCRRR